MIRERIAIAGDWFRAYPSQGVVAGTVRSNVRWLAGMMSAPFNLQMQHQNIVMPDVTPDGFRADLDDAALAQRFDEDPHAAWLASFDGSAALGAFPRLLDRLTSADVVVGFELPPVIRRSIASRGGRYVSIHVHPLRFLPDLAFGVHSNCPAIQQAINAISMAEDAAKPQVARFSARLSRLAPCQAELPDGCPVLFGQSMSDASLIVAAEIGTWQDHRDRLAELLDGHDQVAFIRHPYGNWPVQTIEWLRHELDKTVIAMAGNGYPVIMSGQRLGPVISLSSSIGVEAAAFGHDSHFLLSDPRRTFGVSGLDNEWQFMVGHQLLDRAFWQSVLEGSALPEATSDPFHLGPDFLRNSLDSWSYTSIAGVGPLPDCTKTVVPSRQSTTEEIDRLVAALAGQPTDLPALRAVHISAAAARGAHIRCFPPALASGMSWQWDRGTECLNLPGAEGFGQVEPYNTWLESQRCVVRLPLRGGALRGQRLTGRMRFSFFDGIVGDYPALLLRANGRPVAAWVHIDENNASHTLPFDFTTPAGEFCTLSLEVSHMASPAALGTGADVRQLGISIFEMSIMVTDSDSTGDDDALWLWGLSETSIQVSASTN